MPPLGMGLMIKCTSCSYNDTFLLGVSGTPHYDIELELLHPSTREQIKRDAGNTPVTGVECERHLFQCQKCDHLFERPLVEIRYGDNEVYDTNTNCSRCDAEGKNITNPESEINNLNCPKCQRKTLVIDSFTMWD